MQPTKVLIILTSHAQLGTTGKPTGFWFEELAAPYYELTAAGATVDLASPAGGPPPIDPKSMTDEGPVARFRKDAAAMAKLETTHKLADVKTAYDGYFVVGGHGVMWDLANHPEIQRILGGAADAGSAIAAVCHGPAALVGVKRSNGRSIVEGLRVTGFSDDEEAAVGLTEAVPFLLEQRLGQLGGRYEKRAMWSSFAVRDGKLVTGQNPQSSAETARELLAAIRG